MHRDGTGFSHTNLFIILLLSILAAVMTATSFAALTYIGFDGVTTLAEEVKNPGRNLLLAPVTGLPFHGSFQRTSRSILPSRYGQIIIHSRMLRQPFLMSLQGLEARSSLMLLP